MRPAVARGTSGRGPRVPGCYVSANARGVAELALACLERRDDVGIELRARRALDLVASGLPRPRRAVRALAHHRVERVGDRQDARAERDRLSGAKIRRAPARNARFAGRTYFWHPTPPSASA